MSSSVYIQAGMQGDLEKKGIWRNTKYAATVQGSTLYLEKGGVMNLVELSGAHLVRKVDDDSSGLQLEISFQKKNKSMIFICPNKEACDSWVKALREAIVHKDTLDREIERPRKGSSSQFFVPPADEDETDIYSTIHDHDVQVVSDSLVSKTQEISLRGEADNIYSNVISTPGVSENVKDKNESTIQTVSSSGDLVSPVAMRKPSFIAEDSSSTQLTTSTRENAIPDARGEFEVTRGQDTLDSDSHLQHVNSETFLSDTKRPSIDETPATDGTGDDGDDVKDLLDVLSEALSVSHEEASELNHPLQSEDFIPLRELSEFLNNNQIMCRLSRVSRSAETDPVANLKQYLHVINAAS